MNRELRPSTWSGLHRRPAACPERSRRVGRRSHRYATPIAAVINPRRMKKKLADVVQKLDRGSSGAKNDARYERNATETPPVRNHRFNRRSASGVRVRSSSTPRPAPAATKATHGKSVKFVRPGMGRR